MSWNNDFNSSSNKQPPPSSGPNFPPRGGRGGPPPRLHHPSPLPSNLSLSTGSNEEGEIGEEEGEIVVTSAGPPPPPSSSSLHGGGGGGILPPRNTSFGRGRGRGWRGSRDFGGGPAGRDFSSGRFGGGRGGRGGISQRHGSFTGNLPPPPPMQQHHHPRSQSFSAVQQQRPTDPRFRNVSIGSTTGGNSDMASMATGSSSSSSNTSGLFFANLAQPGPPSASSRSQSMGGTMMMSSGGSLNEESGGSMQFSPRHNTNDSFPPPPPPPPPPSSSLESSSLRNESFPPPPPPPADAPSFRGGSSSSEVPFIPPPPPPIPLAFADDNTNFRGGGSSMRDTMNDSFPVMSPPPPTDNYSSNYRGPPQPQLQHRENNEAYNNNMPPSSSDFRGGGNNPPREFGEMHHRRSMNTTPTPDFAQSDNFRAGNIPFRGGGNRRGSDSFRGGGGRGGFFGGGRGDERDFRRSPRGGDRHIFGRAAGSNLPPAPPSLLSSSSSSSSRQGGIGGSNLHRSSRIDPPWVTNEEPHSQLQQQQPVHPSHLPPPPPPPPPPHHSEHHPQQHLHLHQQHHLHHQDEIMIGKTNSFGDRALLRKGGPPVRGVSDSDVYASHRNRGDWLHHSSQRTSSPHVSPSQSRTNMPNFTSFQDSSSPPSPPDLSTSTTTTHNEPTKTTEVEQPSPAVPQAPPPPPPSLLTSDLGDAHCIRAEEVISEVCELLLDTTDQLYEDEENRARKLPTMQQIYSAMAKLDDKIKDCQREIEEKKESVARALRHEEVERKKAKVNAIAEAKRQAEEKLQKEQDRLLKEEEAREAEIKAFVDERTGVFEKELENSSMELEEKLKLAKEDEEKKLREALNEQLITTADNFDQEIAKVRKELERVTQIMKKTETKLLNAEKDYREKMEKVDMDESHEASPKAYDLVANIIAENRRRAAESHLAQRMIVTIADDFSDGIVDHLENLRDPKENRTIAEWSLMTKQVTGLADALYTDPSESPYFEHNERIHEMIAPLVTEYVRDTENRLKNHWTQLAEEYEYRRELHENDPNYIKAKARPKKSIVPVCHSIFATRESFNPVRESSAAGGRSANPYRRARRGNEVRSEYEQEQIIQEIAAKEALEKRIEFGGSELPRQVGRLEKYLRGEFIRTFTDQKMDVMEQEREFANTNVWTDMEKAIFLDRFLQFPKDFKKIASFLRSKTTKDCVRFYYDSKQSVPYKGALREHIMRRKKKGDYQVWDATIQAALSVGAVIEAGTSEEKPLVFYLPENDHTYFTRNLHPMKREIYDQMKIEDDDLADVDDEDEPQKRCKSRKRPPEPLFVLDASQRKYLKTYKEASYKESTPTALKKSQNRPTIAEQESDEDGGLTPARKAPQKWTAAEKKIFLETLQKHGRDWSMLSQSVGTKTIFQIKNYYYDIKKQGKLRNEKKIMKGEAKAKKRETELTTPPPDSLESLPESPVAETQTDVIGPTSKAEPNNSQTLVSQQAQQPEKQQLLLQQQLQQQNQHQQQQVQLAQQLQHSQFAQQQQRLQAHYGIHPDRESGLHRSGTSTPDPMELWVQRGLLQGNSNTNNLSEEAIRRLLQQHAQPQSQHQQLLANLSWLNSGQMSQNNSLLQSLAELGDPQQLQNFLQMHQQQQQQQQHHQRSRHRNPLAAALSSGSLHSLGLSSLAAGLSSLGHPSDRPSFHHHRQQHHHHPHHAHHASFPGAPTYSSQSTVGSSLNNSGTNPSSNSSSSTGNEDAQLALVQHLLQLQQQQQPSHRSGSLTTTSVVEDALAQLARGFPSSDARSSSSSQPPAYGNPPHHHPGNR